MSKKNTQIFENYLRPLLLPFLGGVLGYLVLFTRLDSRVSAIEERNERLDPLVERFFQLEERNKILFSTVVEIDAKVDLLLQQYRGANQDK